MENSEENPKKQQKDLFYKQQQQRLQNITLKNNLSADDLIRNILEKVDSDAKISKLCVPQQRSSQQSATTVASSTSSPQSNCLPIPQCFLMTNEIPAIYQQVWNAAKPENSSGDICDRDKLYQVLLLSNLPSHVLAQLWGFVNRTIPGQLTKQELFLMLALIGLIQGNSPQPVDELYKVTSIPLPQFPKLPHSEDNNPFRGNTQVKASSTSAISSHEITLTEPSNTDEDFADFKSADFVTPADNNVTKLGGDFKLETTPANHFDRSVVPAAHDENVKEKDTSPDSIDAVFDDFNLSNGSEGPSSEVNNLSLVDEVNSLNEASPSSNNLPPLPSSSDTSICVPASEADKPVKDSESDRYRSLRALTTNTQSNESDDFGDFFSHSAKDCDTQTQEEVASSLAPKEKIETVPAISNKRKILTAICKVMQKTFNILLINHDEESVLEALASKDGVNFANDLKEVFAIAQRISGNLQVLNNASEIDMCNAVFEETSNKWHMILNLVGKSSPNPDREKSGDPTHPPPPLPPPLPLIPSPVIESASSSSVAASSLSPCDPCSICSDVCQPPMSSLLFAGFRYHCSCANFWLNYVDSSLPHRHYEDF